MPLYWPSGAAACVVVRPVAPTTSFTTNYDEATVNAALSTAWPSATCRCNVFHFDCFWMKAFQWCDFGVGPGTFLIRKALSAA